MNDVGCLFCKVIAGQIPADIIGRNANAVAFADINPQAPTHVLIVPVEHIVSITDIRPEQAGIVSDMISLANRQADELGVSKSGFRLVVNNGPHAGQSVDHLHLHLLGGRNMAWPPG